MTSRRSGLDESDTVHGSALDEGEIPEVPYELRADAGEAVHME